MCVCLCECMGPVKIMPFSRFSFLSSEPLGLGCSALPAGISTVGLPGFDAPEGPRLFVDGTYSSHTCRLQCPHPLSFDAVLRVHCDNPHAAPQQARRAICTA